MFKGKRILVTSGGTREYIDDVRVLTNISSGKLGAEIASTLIRADAQVHYLYGQDSFFPDSFTGKSYSKKMVKSAQDAYNEMEKIVPEMDAVIHCMAVSDFTFKRDIAIKCKSSDPQAFIDYMARTIMKNPKIISKVKEWNPKTILIGFKFEVDVSNEILIKLARNSKMSNGCDLVIANDKEEMIREKVHVAYAVESAYANSQAFKIEGKEKIAQYIESFLKAVFEAQGLKDAFEAQGLKL